MKKVYGLTDGTELFYVKIMTDEEWESENKHAAEMTGDTFSWVQLSSLPVSEDVPSSIEGVQQ